MRCIIKYDSQLYGNRVTCMRNVITQEPRVFLNKPEAVQYAKLSNFKNYEVIPVKGYE